MKTFKEIMAWCMFDFAETGFSALFVTFFFPVLILEHLGGTQFMIGMVMGVSTAVAGLTVPFVGALSDASKRRMPFIIFFVITTSILTFFMALVNLWGALILAVIINMFYRSSLDIYDSMLGDIKDPRVIGRVSGWGTGVGYLGSLASLILAKAVLYIFGNGELSVRAMFPATAIFYIAFASIMIVTIKDQKKRKINCKKVTKQAAKDLITTIKELPSMPGVLIFLIGSFLFMDGANTGISFLYAYGSTAIGITKEQFIPIFMLAAVASGIGAIIFGKLTDEIGPKKTLIYSILLWIIIIVGLQLSTTLIGYTIASCFGGAALAALWTATRPMLIRLAPKDKLAKLFGFQGLTEKFGAFLAPPLFGLVSDKYGGQYGLMVLIVFFVLALILMLKTPDTPVKK